VPTLVLLPGMDGTGALFEPFIAALGSGVDVRVVRYPVDLPLGYAELEAQVRQSLPSTDPFVVLGESFSGPIVLSLIASPPPGMIGAVLCCTFMRNPRPRLAILQPLIGVLPVARAPSIALSFFLFGKYSNAVLMVALTNALAKLSPAVLRARLKAVASVEVSLPSDVDVPVLCLRAAQDRLVPASAASEVVRAFSRVISLTMDGPHLLLQARPAEAAAIVARFLRELPVEPKLVLSN